MKLERLQSRVALAIAAVALLCALSGIAGAYAGQVLITGKQIRNGSLTTQDYKKGSVQTSDVKDGAISGADVGDGAVGAPDLQDGGITSTDIGTNQVTPTDIDLPDPVQTVEPGAASASLGTDFVNLDPIETYVKVDGTSDLEVTWSGSAEAGFSPCQFQIRVDGQAAAAGAGVVYVANGTINGNVSTTALFSGLPAGPHDVAIYARAVNAGGSYPCTIGPAGAQMVQTFITGEQVL